MKEFNGIDLINQMRRSAFLSDKIIINKMKNPEINDVCDVNYDGRYCLAIVQRLNIPNKTFDVITSFGQCMNNISFDKFRYNHLETKIAEYDTLDKIIKQLEGCMYENEAGYLNNNIAFMALKRMAINQKIS